MAISKIIYKANAQDTGTVWMDATPATAAAADITAPKTAMLADGVMTTGTGSGGGGTLITKTITTNGTYDASDDNADGYSEVTVNVTGLKHESGTFTCPNSGTTGTLNFTNTYSKYMIIIEATDASKESIMDSGQTSARTFGIVGYYPKISIDNNVVDTNTALLKVVPTTGVTSTGNTGNFTYSSTSVVYPLSTVQYANYLYQGYSYKYSVVEVP